MKLKSHDLFQMEWGPILKSLSDTVTMVCADHREYEKCVKPASRQLNVWPTDFEQALLNYR